MIILHATTTKVKNRPHQKTITHPHTTPLSLLKKMMSFWVGEEGVIYPPLPHGEHKKIPVKETLLFDQIKMYHSAKIKRKTNMIKWTNLRLTPITFEI